MIWLIVAVYAVVWVLAIPRFLRARMEAMVCVDCGERWCVSSWHHRENARGALRPRRGSDVAAAIATAALWPGFLVCLTVALCGVVLGEAITMLVFRATPLTAPEREREEYEHELAFKKRQAEITALEQELRTRAGAVEDV